MSGYCFHTPEAQALVEKAGIKQEIERFAEENKKQTYILHRPLSKEDSHYDYDDAVVIFSTGLKPCFVDINKNEEGFEDYRDDFIDDVSFLSEKFKYRQKIGRKKHWDSLFESCSYEELDFENLKINSATDKRIADLIISLVIGSINDVTTVDLEAENLLDIVKSKIILFDTDQTSFVFKSNSGKKYVIQGLAGSGKTELLLHKLKEIYSSNKDARIAFTCHNRILASSMKSRIPEFFDFMRVEKQIEWDSKLFCFHAWGSTSIPHSGMYRYICHSYGIPFGTYRTGSFDYLCKKAIEEIKSIDGDKKSILDYVFIDESQDFEDSFIELCELVTENKVYVAGDVFQNIFRPIDASVNKADLLLKKCYRTDPKNLMFSHALGMGLYEEPVLRWLTDDQWYACGYNYTEKSGRALIRRDPLRRFEDIPKDFESTILHHKSKEEPIVETVMNTVQGIIKRHPSVEPGDIAIIFLDKDDYIYNVIPTIRDKIVEELEWEVNISFETKRSDVSKLFVSNINNAKGLEFPFVICYTKQLKRQPSFRNALYTMMARSFLESHLIAGSETSNDLIKELNAGLENLNSKGYMDLRVPEEEEISGQQELFDWEENQTVEDQVRAFCESKSASPRLVAKLTSRIMAIIGNEEYEDEYITSLLELEYKRNRKL